MVALGACSSGSAENTDEVGLDASGVGLERAAAGGSLAVLSEPIRAAPLMGDPSLANAGIPPSAELTADPPFANALPIAPILEPTSADAGADHYSITIQPGLVQMRAGAPTPIVGFDGIAPGPTIVATRGRTVEVTQHNEWTEDLTIHNHGHKVAASSDGHPTDYITPGSSKVYTYPNDQNAGTYWLHDHTMDLTAPHVYHGLASFYIIRDPAEDALGLPTGAHDIPLAIQDKTFDENNSLAYEPSEFLGFFGDTAVVNGAATPHLDVGTRKYRLRLLNASNARPYALQLRVTEGEGAAEVIQVIASDGGLLRAPVELATLPIAPAERYDVVVDFSKYPVGTKLELVNAAPTIAAPGPAGRGGFLFGLPVVVDRPFPVNGPPGFDLSGLQAVAARAAGGPPAGAAAPPPLTSIMQFVVARAEDDPSVVPSRLADVQRHDPADAVSTTPIVFGYDGVDWTINGLMYDPERADVRNQLDRVYIWSLTNQSPIPHPFHKHLSLFNVLDINGQPPPPFMSGWKDTVMVPPGSTVRIAFVEESFTGTYVFHCHNLEHEDHGMMLQEQVGD
jgi:spore coat protein A